MMHAIGFDHEHVRPNRDDYITVNFSNIVKGDYQFFIALVSSILIHYTTYSVIRKKSILIGREMWFEKAKKEAPYNEGFQYDLCSLMHYQSRAFSKNGFSTIIPKVGTYFNFLLPPNVFLFSVVISCSKYLIVIFRKNPSALDKEMDLVASI